MRFAYIDSHGNEVPIPSVDALALRIELGAIGPDTQLYDAQADHWAPASTHEIFHTLSRDAQPDGFVAPPPVAPPPPAATSAAEPAKPKTKPKEKEKEKRKAEPAVPTTTDLGLTLAEPLPPPSTPSEESDPGTSALDLSLDLAPPAAPPAAASPATSAPAGNGEATFDYGDLDSGLQLEEEEPAPEPEPMMSFGAPMQFGGGGGADDLELERPMSEFSPDAPPDWMGPPSSEEGVLSFSPDVPAAEPPAPKAPPAVGSPVRQKRAPKDRPSTPKFKSQRSLAVPIFLAVLLLALGVGGYWGWPLVQARLAQPEEPVRPAVVLPALPPELMPRMRELAEGAIASTIAAVDVETRVAGVPAEMDSQWLGGNYLANASQFAGVEAFWTSMGTFMDGVRAADWRRYHDELVESADAAGLDAEAAGMVVERADSGFVAAADARYAAYDVLDDVIDAALSLHAFLVASEDDIDYRPATSSIADPILEAVPSSAAIGDRMLELVDGVTEGLRELGSLDRVTRARLVTALTTRVQQVGLQ